MKKSGFTIVELVIATAVLAILVTIGLFSYSSYVRRNQTTQNRLNAEEIIRKMTVWTTVEKRYPSELGDVTDPNSLINTISSDVRERLAESAENGGSPSEEYPKNIEVRFCYRLPDTSTPVGARAYYWDLQDKVQKYQYYGNSEEPSVSCQP